MTPKLPLPRRPRGGDLTLIFDFDGVIIDSEVVSIECLVEQLKDDLGMSIGLDQAMALFLGRRWVETTALASKLAGRPIPADMHKRWIARIMNNSRRRMTLVKGAEEFLAATICHPRAIASSSSPEWISHWVQYFHLGDAFGANIVSGMDSFAAKPDPEILLIAMKRLGVAAEQAVLIDDSPLGIEAGRRASVRTIGLCAGSHMTIGDNRKRLEEANPTILAESYSEILNFLNR